jgi:hypothetical protein
VDINLRADTPISQIYIIATREGSIERLSVHVQHKVLVRKRTFADQFEILMPERDRMIRIYLILFDFV